MKLKHFVAIACIMPFVTSCILDSYRGIYGEDEPLRLVDDSAEEVNKVSLTRWDKTKCYILGGMGANYEVEVQDTSLLSCSIHRKTTGRLQHADRSSSLLQLHIRALMAVYEDYTATK